VSDAFAKGNPLDRELSLDRFRWGMIEEKAAPGESRLCGFHVAGRESTAVTAAARYPTRTTSPNRMNGIKNTESSLHCPLAPSDAICQSLTGQKGRHRLSTPPGAPLSARRGMGWRGPVPSALCYAAKFSAPNSCSNEALWRGAVVENVPEMTSASRARTSVRVMKTRVRGRL